MDLAVIIVNYNTRELLRDCLSSVRRASADLDIEIFVVDNASMDDSAEMVESEFPEVCVLRSERNVGFAAGNNIALRVAQGDYVLLLNSDTVVQPGAFSDLVRFMNATPAAGYCGPKLQNADRSHQGSAYRFPTVLTAMLLVPMLGHTRRFERSRHWSSLHPAKGSDGIFRADWLSGACLLVRRKVLNEIGFLDEGYFMYAEETDWCRRMANAGWEGWYVGTASVVHLGGQSVALESDRRLFAGHHPEYHVQSHRRYMRRHHGFLASIISEGLQIAMYILVWMRNSRPFRDRTPEKAQHAAEAIRHLLVRTKKIQPQ